MKGSTFKTFFTVEVIVALIAMGLMFSDLGAIVYVLSAILFAAVLVPLLVAIKRADSEAKKKRLRLIIVLLTGIPIVVAVALIICVVVALLLYFE